jgi:hypothetical protein
VPILLSSNGRAAVCYTAYAGSNPAERAEEAILTGKVPVLKTVKLDEGRVGSIPTASAVEEWTEEQFQHAMEQYTTMLIEEPCMCWRDAVKKFNVRSEE